MPTSSLFTNFNITDEKTARAFVKALDASAKDPKRVPTSSVKAYVSDPEEIRRLYEKSRYYKKP